MELEGRIAVVTGAGRGIGRATALELARMGAGIVIAELDRAGADATAAEILALGRRVSVVPTDVTSKADEGTLFVIDLKYAGLFGVRNVPDDQLQPFFLAEAPRILFPFARRVVADAVRDGGFPPLLLEPIDFHGLFMQQLQAQGEGQGEIPAPVGEA